MFPVRPIRLFDFQHHFAIPVVSEKKAEGEKKIAQLRALHANHLRVIENRQLELP
jgi:hypothetical protein